MEHELAERILEILDDPYKAPELKPVLIRESCRFVLAAPQEPSDDILLDAIIIFMYGIYVSQGMDERELGIRQDAMMDLRNEYFAKRGAAPQVEPCLYLDEHDSILEQIREGLNWNDVSHCPHCGASLGDANG